jgi:gentisate 1,2-dioxygenase
MSEPQAAALRALVADMAEAHASPLWSLYASQLTREPRAPDDARHWPWATMQPLLHRALAHVPMEHAERRVLLLSHPAFAPRTATTTNLQGGLQVLAPGDRAPPHRHAAAAVRFVMSGQGAFTTVNGVRCPMAPGDLVLTPAWCWHEHEHPGSEPIVWFDGLDVPLVQALSTAFLEFGPVPAAIDATAAPAAPEPRFHHSGAAAAEALAATPPSAADGSRTWRYTDPRTGGPVTPTLDAQALGLAPGRPTVPQRSTANAIAVVVQGQGESTVGERTIRWRRHDVFSLPHWNWIRHRADDDGAHLFLLSDRPVLEALGYLRTETRS